MSHDPSKVTAIKDQTVGAIKETVGNLIGNEKLELKGRAQKVHGKNEYEYAKAHKEGETEPEHFQQAYHEHSDNQIPQEHIHQQNQQPTNNIPQHQQTNIPEHPYHQPSNLPPIPAAVPPPPQQSNIPAPAPIPPSTMGAPVVNNNQVPPPLPPHQEQNPSQIHAMKDQAMGTIKENMGSSTNNQQMEIAGKAQNIHGHNEAEFAKAQKQGLDQPQHFDHGTKTTDHAEGSIEGDKVSTLGALKDKTMGSIKQTLGSATGNQQMELQGKAQQIHGRNEAEFVKAQNEGLNEPVHYQHGTKTTDHAHGEVVGNNEPSKMTGYKDQAVGSIKETWGSMTGNQQMEIEGKAQKMQGSAECSGVKNPINA